MHKVAIYRFPRRFCSNFFLKYLFFFLIVMVIISFGRVALLRQIFNTCDLLCNSNITQLTLHKEIQFSSIQFQKFSGFLEKIGFPIKSKLSFQLSLKLNKSVTNFVLLLLLRCIFFAARWISTEFSLLQVFHSCFDIFTISL